MRWVRMMSNGSSYSVLSSPDIQELHSIFPDKSVETLASLYWDNGNNLTKTVNKILGSNSSMFPIN